MVATRYTLADLSKSGYSTEVVTTGTAVFSTGSANFRFSGSGPTFADSAVTEILHSFRNSLLY